MNRRTVLFAAVLSLLASASAAEDFSVGDVEIGNPWARATPKGANVAGAYMSITNKGSAPDRLISGSTPVASRFEVHTMMIEDGIAKMRPVEGGLEVKPHQTVELKPGSYHVMLTGLTQPLQQGERVPGTLVFERAGKVDVEFTVVPIGQNAPAAAGGHRSGH